MMLLALKMEEEMPQAKEYAQLLDAEMDSSQEPPKKRNTAIWNFDFKPVCLISDFWIA